MNNTIKNAKVDVMMNEIVCVIKYWEGWGGVLWMMEGTNDSFDRVLNESTWLFNDIVDLLNESLLLFILNQVTLILYLIQFVVKLNLQLKTVHFHSHHFSLYFPFLFTLLAQPHSTLPLLLTSPLSLSSTQWFNSFPNTTLHFHPKYLSPFPSQIPVPISIPYTTPHFNPKYLSHTHLQISPLLSH
jgi:hypothetical protein